MDRTREFLLFVESTHLPQRRMQEVSNSEAETICSLERDIEEVEHDITRKRPISQSRMEKAQNALSHLLTAPLKQRDPGLRTSIEIGRRRKYTAFSLRLAEALRKEKRQKQEAVRLEEESRTNSIGFKQPHTMAAQEHLARRYEIQKEEMHEVRRREMEAIEAHINELGKMVSEVSIHISMQGERLQRVDELFDKARGSLKRGHFELKHALIAVKQKRKTLLILFAVLFSLFLLRVLL